MTVAPRHLLDELRGTGALPVVLNGDITPEVWFHHQETSSPSLTPKQKMVYKQVDRYMEFWRNSTVVVNKGPDLEAIREEIEENSSDRAARRQAEQRLASYIDSIPDPLNIYRLDELAEKLRTCRTKGVVGVKPGGGYMVAWDSKCSMVRLCPDEAREETQRLAEKYVPAMLKWQQEKPGKRRIFYAVFTDHNYRPGQLLAGKKHLFERFKDWQSLTYDACPVVYRNRRPLANGRKKKLKAWPGLHGSLVVQEDPLSASDDWNVHLNAFLLWEGPCDFKAIRQEWGANVHLQQVDPQNLTRALLEAVKYSAQIVPTKSEAKASRHASDAPTMIEWPHARFLEWWKAQQGFRRTRSYGALYRVQKPEPEKVEMDLIQWVGQMRFVSSSRGPAYRVDLIPGDNFSRTGAGGHGKNKFGLGETPETGPPPELL